MSEVHSQWGADIALATFEMRRLKFPDDYDGEVLATLLRRKASGGSKKAVLYIHGYMDYFFQAHLADFYNEQGFNFYALDLRKYGRSLGTAQHPNYCRDIREYFAEISESIRIICEEDGQNYLVLNGHSTGGLISTLYAATGENRQRINAVILNSPFYQWNVPGVMGFAMKVLGWFAGAAPSFGLAGKDVLPYIQSIHKNYQGEWDFSLEYRKPEGFPIYTAWVKAISNAHAEIAKGVDLQCPVLVLHSDKSIYGTSYSPEFQTGDAVLGVHHIKESSQNIGKQVTVVEIKEGLHDLILSRKEVREETLKQMRVWLEAIAAKVPERAV